MDKCPLELFLIDSNMNEAELLQMTFNKWDIYFPSHALLC